jgi:hypothetical protein
MKSRARDEVGIANHKLEIGKAHSFAMFSPVFGEVGGVDAGVSISEDPYNRDDSRERLGGVSARFSHDRF